MQAHIDIHDSLPESGKSPSRVGQSERDLIELPVTIGQFLHIPEHFGYIRLQAVWLQPGRRRTGCVTRTMGRHSSRAVQHVADGASRIR